MKQRLGAIHLSSSSDGGYVCRHPKRIPGEHRFLAIPVPIPNTVVKQGPPMILQLRESRLSPGPSTRRLFRKSRRLFFVVRTSDACIRAALAPMALTCEGDWSRSKWLDAAPAALRALLETFPSRAVPVECANDAP